MMPMAEGAREERINALDYDYASQPKVFEPKCGLCGSENWVIITHSDRYGYPAQAMACRKCGLTTLNPRMTPEAYTEFYISVYRPLVSAFHGRLIDAKTVQGEQIPYAADMAALIRPFLTPAHKTMLDVGGSTGVISAHFAQQFELKCTLIDPAPAETAEAKAMGIEAVTGFIETWDPGMRKFDVIGLFQTIDHLLDLRASLTKIREVISIDGLFMVDIVDFRAAYLRNKSVESAVKIDHVYSLTEDTMEALLAQIGFDIVQTSYSADHLHVMYICRPGVPNPSALPSEAKVREYFREIRAIQNSK